MASVDRKLCNICELKHQTNDAEEWCPECEEYLCSSCKIHHSLAKSSRNHKTVKIVDVENLPAFVLEMKTECEEHGEKLEYFCPKHDTPFCIKCTVQHQACGELTVIRQLKQTKTSPYMVDIEDTLNELSQSLKAILDDRNSNLSRLRDQEENCRKQIQDIRKSINDHLDQLEKEILRELEITYASRNSELERFVKDVTTHKSTVDQIQSDVVKIKNHASDIQIFLSTQTLKENMQSEKAYADSLLKDGKLYEIEISYTADPTCLGGNILSTFGKIEVYSKPVKIRVSKQKDKEAQMLMEVSPKDIEQIILQKLTEIDLSKIPGGVQIEGFTTMPDGCILLADQKQNRVVILAADGSYISEISLRFPPNDIVFVNNQISVSSCPKKKLASIDLENKQVIKEVDIKVVCGGLVVVGNKIVLYISDCEYRIFDLNLKQTGTIPIKLKKCPYLSYHNEKLYFAQWTTNTVFCYDMTGNCVWGFKDERLQSPHGIAVDRHGLVYVCGYKSHNIMVISSDGGREKELVNLTGIMEKPLCLDCDKHNDRLLVISRAQSKLIQFDFI